MRWFQDMPRPRPLRVLPARHGDDRKVLAAELEGDVRVALDDLLSGARTPDPRV